MDLRKDCWLVETMGVQSEDYLVSLMALLLADQLVVKTADL